MNLGAFIPAKAIIGYFYMMLVMFFSTSTTLLTSYLTSILKVDSTTIPYHLICLPDDVFGGVHLFLVVPVATLAVSFLDSGRNELFRPVLREPLFRDLTG